MVKISGLLIGIIIIGMILTGLNIFMGEMSSNYYVDYDNSSISNLTSKMDDVNTLAEQTKANATALKSDATITDIVGNFFSKGYAAFTIVLSSFDITQEIITLGSSELGVGGYFSLGLTAIVLISIFIGVIFYVIFKVKV